MEKFVQKGFYHEFADIFALDNHKEAIVELDGFGEKSYDKLIKSVEKVSSCPACKSDLRAWHFKCRPFKCQAHM